MRRLLFRLCLSCGYPHPDHLLRELSSRQVSEWMAYAQIEPVGTPDRERVTYGEAMTVSVLANAYRDRMKRAQAYTPEDFLPKERETAEDAVAWAEGIVAAFGGVDLRTPP